MIGATTKRAALARALALDPEILFLDEPCASLDGRATREIEAILSDAFSNGVRILMSTHDMGQARRLATEVLFLHKGLIHEAAPAEAFFADPATAEALKRARAGDLLVLLSDGIYEYEDPNGEQFGAERVAGLLKQHRSLPAAELAETVLRGVETHGKGAPQNDDITIVLVRRQEE